MLESLKSRTITRLPDQVSFRGRILFLAEDPGPIRRLRWSLPLILAGLCLFVGVVRPGKLAAQVVGPLCPGNCTTYAVVVTPDGTIRTRTANGSGFVDTFTVRNGGTNNTEIYDLTCTPVGSVTTCSLNVPTVTLSAGQSAKVIATYSTGAVATGTLWLDALGRTGQDEDLGSFAINYRAAPTAVAMRNHARDYRDRALCLTAGAGEAAAWECGDLVVTHGLPGYATMGRERSLTLLYNSAVASPRLAVGVTVTESGALKAPDTLVAILRINTGAGFVQVDSAKYGGWAGGSGPARQLLLRFNATSYPSGIYPLQFEVQNRYIAAASYGTVLGDTLMVVNRNASRFGTGWWPAGVEQLVLGQPVSAPSTGDLLWIGGDGSAKWYRRVTGSTTRWAAPAGAGLRDTITYDSAAQTYTDSLRHGIAVTFDASGRHTVTTSRTSQQTRFTWGAGDSLVSIRVPPNGASRTTYTFAYDGSGKLDKITDPVGRVLDVTVASGRLTAVVDPDTTVATTFGYDATTGLMTSRVNRLGYTTTYTFAQKLRLDKAILPGRSALSDTIVYQPWDEKGLALTPTGQTAVDTAVGYTRILGPRSGVADDATFWIDQWGAPVTIVNALGQTTKLRHITGSATPALVDTVIGVDGRLSVMTYDARGNLLTLKDSTAHLTNGQPTALTRWTYQSPNTKDSPDTVFSPMGLVTRYQYTTLGLTSLVIEPNGQQTSYAYVAATDSLHGLLRSVTAAQVQTWTPATHTKAPVDLVTRFGFDALGNVVADTSPAGRVRVLGRDTLERVVNFYDAAGHRTEYVYDPANRQLRTREHVEQGGYNTTLFPPDSGFAAALETRSFYHLGLLDSIWDPRQVARRYVYDPGGRVTQELDEANVAEVRWYNAAGQVDSLQRRSGEMIRNAWDSGGRLRRTSWPARDSIPADSVVYTYDAANRQISARRSAGSIWRTWTATGLLKTEVDTLASGGMPPETQTFTYDSAGRRTGQVITAFGDTMTTDSLSYSYNAGGDLRWIRVHWRNPNTDVAHPDPWIVDTVRLFWDGLGRRDSVYFRSAATALTYGYDADGLLRLVCSQGGPQSGNNVNLNTVLYHDSVDVDGMLRSTTRDPTGRGLPSTCSITAADVNQASSYGARHQLLSQATTGHQMVYRYDASGNRTRWLDPVRALSLTDSMNPARNRLVWERDSLSTEVTRYAWYADGSRRVDTLCYQGTCNPERVYAYDGLGRMIGAAEAGCTVTAPDGTCIGVGALLTAYCAYDPLGRLAKSCEATNNINILYDGANVVRAAQVILQGLPQQQGSGWSFVQGPGVDDPLLGYYPNAKRHAYFITDGQGRQIVVADLTGDLVDTTYSYTSRGGSFAGGVRNSFSFGAERTPSNTLTRLSFFRNRVYDQQTGRWTQEDPVGAAGGVNLYQFNGNNPAAYTDPFGLYPFVNCRPVGGEGSKGTVAHCAVRVVDPERHIDQTIELIPNRMIGGTNEIHWSSGAGNARTAKYDPNTWAKVATPAGMTTEQFDNAVLMSALRQTGLDVLQDYGAGGTHNSNHFVYSVVTGAGGTVPEAPTHGFTMGAPGLCGGSGVSTGTHCSH